MGQQRGSGRDRKREKESKRREAVNHSLKDVPTWLAQTLRVLSRLMTRRILPEGGWRILTSPVPRSFHSETGLSNRKSLARLTNGRLSCQHSARRAWAQGRGTHILKMTVSFSSPVVVAILSESLSLWTGSNWGSTSWRASRQGGRSERKGPREGRRQVE